eukprot:scaffold1513_cov100-Amphora_coffeaeformis.AAC.32
MQNAIACNARAIYKMESKDYEGAFNLLRISMMSLNGPLCKTIGIMKEDHGTEKGLVLASSTIDPTTENLYTGSFVYSIPGPTISKRQIDFCSAVCLFNMALACHLEYGSIVDVRKRTYLLAQSRLLYLTAYEILQKYSIEPNDNIILVLMALAANMIEIDLELGNVSDVMFWRRILEAATFAADPLLFVGSMVHEFFNSVYIPPGDINAAKAA